MKRPRFRRPSGVDAFTRTELAMSAACVALLVAVAGSAQQDVRERSASTNCSFNIRFLSLALRLFSNDNRETFPMSLSAAKGGSRQSAETGEAFRHFTALNKQLTPADLRRLVCPADPGRAALGDFSRLSNRNLSYWLGLDADETHPAMFLLGDRNLTNGTTSVHHILALGAEPPAGWTGELHHGQGNIGLVDGSVATTTPATLAEKLAKANMSAPKRLTRIQLPEIEKP
ncbi:MAG: hypothetical protein HYR88_02015 [Verrucomicrobia bacterium]|nr:hypothetical protein [Verrucomicrobiota bacterium]MBI3868516.1 hypothetical protein [Verrucomicrobiota bacterium]